MRALEKLASKNAKMMIKQIANSAKRLGRLDDDAQTYIVNRADALAGRERVSKTVAQRFLAGMTNERWKPANIHKKINSRAGYNYGNGILSEGDYKGLRNMIG